MEKEEKDRVFAERKEAVRPFEFNKEVTRVFDDMLHRSVPLYAESIYRQSQLASEYCSEGSRIYDLGCSHGNLGIKVMEQMGEQDYSMIAVDSSLHMIQKYAKRLQGNPYSSNVRLVCGRLEDVKFENASVVLINLTLQFLDLAGRDQLINDIYDGMNPGGILLLTEKTTHVSKEIDDLQTRFYLSYKRENGYSELEISQKRDALEKVLIPESVETHKKRIFDAGFRHFEVWLKWFNFASMIAVK